LLPEAPVHSFCAFQKKSTLISLSCQISTSGSNLGFLKSSTHPAGPEPNMVQGRQAQGKGIWQHFCNDAQSFPDDSGDSLILLKIGANLSMIGSRSF